MEHLITDSQMNSEQLLGISKKSSESGGVIRYDTIEYRGFTINFLSDPMGNQCFGKCNDWLVDLGLNNIYYKEDICRFIDRQLDLITDFRNYPNFVGAKLEYFNNGDYRDIRLLYKGRLIKCFLVVGTVNEESLISEAIQILSTSGLLEQE